MKALVHILLDRHLLDKWPLISILYYSDYTFSIVFVYYNVTMHTTVCQNEARKRQTIRIYIHTIYI